MLLWVVLLQLVCTLFMVGVIAFVQVVHYPLMGAVGTTGYRRYQTHHQRRTTWVVAVPMVLEMAAAVFLGAAQPGPYSLAGLLLVGIIWFSTFKIQVPAHARLAMGYSARTHLLLVRSNWIRTAAWFLRAPIVLHLAVTAL
jgi:hypothetical protein